MSGTQRARICAGDVVHLGDSGDVWFVQAQESAVVRDMIVCSKPFEVRNCLQTRSLTLNVVRDRLALHQVFLRDGDVVSGHVDGKAHVALRLVDPQTPRVPQLRLFTSSMAPVDFLMQAGALAPDTKTFVKYWTQVSIQGEEAALPRVPFDFDGLDNGCGDVCAFRAQLARARLLSQRQMAVVVVASTPDEALQVRDEIRRVVDVDVFVVPMLGYELRFMTRSDVRALAPRAGCWTVVVAVLNVPALYEGAAQQYATRFWGASESHVWRAGCLHRLVALSADTVPKTAEPGTVDQSEKERALSIARFGLGHSQKARLDLASALVSLAHQMIQFEPDNAKPT
jgi:hypothetical protein